MTPTQYLGTDKLPSELYNYIAELVLLNNRTAIILPRQIAAVAAPRTSKGIITCANVVTGHSAMFRASKTLRKIYAPMFRQKVLNMDVTEIVVKVEDFNIKTFYEVFTEITHQVGTDVALAFPYDFHMSFTEEFLCDPDKEPLIDFIETWSPQSVHQFVRFTQINYTVKPIPLQYVDKLQMLINELFFERSGFADPEFKYLMGVFKRFYETREIVKPEDQDKQMIGNWVKGKFVIKEAHEWKGGELDDEDEPMIWFD